MKVKNSNKILLLILGLIIAVPMLVAMVLRHKVHSGQFEIVKADRQKDPSLRQEGRLEGIKVIQLVGPDKKGLSDVFQAIIVNGQQNTYIVKRDNIKDSMRIQRIGDTLVFAYYKDTSDNKRSPYFYSHMNLILNLPNNIPVTAENCTVQFAAGESDTLNGHNAVPGFIYLKNGAVLEMGNRTISYARRADPEDLEAKAVFILDSAETNKKTFDSTFAPMTGFHVFASNSTVKFIQPLLFKDLELDMRDGSALELSHPFKAGHLSGKLDADTEIKGDIHGLKSIKALIKE